MLLNVTSLQYCYNGKLYAKQCWKKIILNLYFFSYIYIYIFLEWNGNLYFFNFLKKQKFWHTLGRNLNFVYSVLLCQKLIYTPLIQTFYHPPKWNLKFFYIYLIIKNCLKYFYIYIEQKSLKMILYIYLKKVCIQSVFISKVLLFFHALYLFVYSTSLCFSSSRRFLYCSQRCFCYFFSLLKKDFDTFYKALFEAFPGIFNEISLTNR